MRARRMTALTMAVLLGAGTLAACSDDGGDDDVALEDIGDDAGDVTTTTGSTGDEDDTDTTLAGGDFAEGCAEFGEAFSALGASLTGEFDESALDDFDAAIDDAPEDIQDDLRVYADAFRQYIDALEEAGVDPAHPEDVDPEDAARLSELIQVFSTEEFADASTAVNEFIASNCGGAG